MLKIISWNVNSIVARSEHVALLLKQEAPDVLFVQETRSDVSKFSNLYDYEILIGAAEKGRSGVAIFLKQGIRFSSCQIHHNLSHARIVICEINIETAGGSIWSSLKSLPMTVKLMSVYVPNGGDIDGLGPKIEFVKKLGELIQCFDGAEIVLGGDFNIVANIDETHFSKWSEMESLCCSLQERQVLCELFSSGLCDAMSSFCDKKEFTWWDYRNGCFAKNKGLTLDKFLLSPFLLDKMVGFRVLKQYRSLEKPSDHAPIEIVIAADVV